MVNEKISKNCLAQASINKSPFMDWFYARGTVNSTCDTIEQNN